MITADSRGVSRSVFVLATCIPAEFMSGGVVTRQTSQPIQIGLPDRDLLRFAFIFIILRFNFTAA